MRHNKTLENVHVQTMPKITFLEGVQFTVCPIMIIPKKHPSYE